MDVGCCSWTTAPSSINAYYTSTRNEIIFLAGILQAPFFDKDYPKYYKCSGFFSHTYTDRSIALCVFTRCRRVSVCLSVTRRNCMKRLHGSSSCVFTYGLPLTHATLVFRKLEHLQNKGPSHGTLFQFLDLENLARRLSPCAIQTAKVVGLLFIQCHLAATTDVESAVYSQRRSPTVDSTRRPVLYRPTSDD